jgi:hypothetical protein
MTDRHEDGDPPTAPPAGDEARADRRAFLRRLPGSAVRTAEQLAGISSIMRRSVVAVGETLIGSVEEPPDESPPSTPEPAGVPAPASAPEVAVAQPVARDPVADLTAEQHAFLREGTSLVIAANDPAGAPHLTSSPYRWTGTMFRVPGRLSSARAIAIDRDPRVSLLIADAASDAWVAVTGAATLGSIDQVETEMLEILEASLGPDAAAARWAEMAALGDAIVIHVRPTRFVWRTV